MNGPSRQDPHDRPGHRAVRTRRGWPRRAWIAAAVLLATAPPSNAALTEGARVAAIYDQILAAHFDRADTAIRTACPPVPETACRTLAAISAWWQILLNPDSRLLDGRFNELAGAAIASGDAWTKREPRRGEAWFYLAGAYAPRVNWRVLRGERLSAARDGNTIREALEQALALDPGLRDAYFGIGLYHYYADVAPAAAKFLRWLLLLPGGDRARGLREMLQAREHGEVMKGEADYQLHLLYLWYENQPREGLRLLEELDRRYPTNPLFLQRIAEVENDYFHDYPASAAAWQRLLARAEAGDVNTSGGAEMRARLGLAAELDATFETDRAIEQLKIVAGSRTTTPYGARAQAELQLGAACDRLGDRDAVTRGYRAAIALAPEDDGHNVRERARAGLRQAPDARARQAYRLSLEGWRAFERGALDEAESRLARATTLAPEDPLTRYRVARLLATRGERERARAEIEKVLATRRVPAPVVLSSAFVLQAELLEQSGERARAIAMYRAAAQVAGGDPRAREQASRALRKLTSTSLHEAKDF